MRIVPLYAGLLALIFLALSVRTLRMRARLRVAIGDAGNEVMLRAMRAHSNFAEYVPLSLILLAFLEAGGARGWFLHALGICLVAGRLVHAYGLSRVPEPGGLRVAGMALTFIPITVAALRLVGAFVQQA